MSTLAARLVSLRTATLVRETRSELSFLVTVPALAGMAVNASTWEAATTAAQNLSRDHGQAMIMGEGRVQAFYVRGTYAAYKG